MPLFAKRRCVMGVIGTASILHKGGRVEFGCAGENPAKFNSACGNGLDFQFFKFNSPRISGYGKLELAEFCATNRILHMKFILIQNVLSCLEG